MNRLKKAASLGFGPLMERGKGDEGGPPDARRASAAPRTYRSRSRSRDRTGASSGVGDAPNSSAALAVREQQERRREALRQVLKQASDEPDVDGFLFQAKKPKPSLQVGPKLDVKVSKLDLKISTSTVARATAAASGARPKAGAKAASKPKEPEEPPPALTQRQQDEKVTAEFKAMQRKAKLTVDPDAEFDDEEDEGKKDDYGDYDSEEEDNRKRKREQKKQREDWRKQRKEDLKKESQKKNQDGSGSESDIKGSDDELTKQQKEEKEASRLRAQTWRTINNNGRYSKVKGQYVGQLSDRDLDKRIQEEKAKNAGQHLMSEAEAIAKIQKGRGGAGGGTGRDRSPKRT